MGSENTLPRAFLEQFLRTAAGPIDPSNARSKNRYRSAAPRYAFLETPERQNGCVTRYQPGPQRLKRLTECHTAYTVQCILSSNLFHLSALQTVGRGRNPVRAEREDEDNRGEWIGVRT